MYSNSLSDYEMSNNMLSNLQNLSLYQRSQKVTKNSDSS